MSMTMNAKTVYIAALPVLYHNRTHQISHENVYTFLSLIIHQAACEWQGYEEGRRERDEDADLSSSDVLVCRRVV